MDIRLFRLAYAIEFLLALVAVFTLWSQVAGQGHLDIIDWHWKLVLGLAAAFAAVKATAASVEGETPWNARARRWLLAVAVILGLCGLVTYYFHLYYEPLEEDQQDEEPLQTSAAHNTSHAWEASAGSDHATALRSVQYTIAVLRGRPWTPLPRAGRLAGGDSPPRPARTRA